MKPYNGFTGKERLDSWALQKLAMANGELVKTPCEICTQSAGLLMPHLEDYDEPIKASKFLCVECHMRLHARFSAPVQWVSHLLEVKQNKKVCPPYEIVNQFFKVRFDWSKKPIPDYVSKDFWYERLSLEPVDFRNLSLEEKSLLVT